MSIFFRRPERRDLNIPWNYGGVLNRNPRTTVTQEKALGLTPVFAALRHITDYSSTLPLKGYRKVGEDRVPMANLPRLFGDLQDSGRLVPWLGECMSSLVLRGNAVGLVTGVDGMGFPIAISWIDMNRVTVKGVPGAPQWFIDGKSVPRLDIVHIPWITVPGQILGLSPLAYYAATVNAGLGAQSFGAAWFVGGGFPPAVFRNKEKTLKAGQADSIRERLVASIRRHEPLVTGADWEYQPITIPPSEAQFIESQKLTANQIAAIYGIEPDEVGGEAANSLTYATEEARQIKRAANLRPYLVRLESAFAAWLPAAQFVKFNTDAIVRADLKTRWEVHKIRHDIGAASVNDIRTTEDEAPIPGGDTYGTYGPNEMVEPKAPARALPAAPSTPGAAARRLSVIPHVEAQYE